MNAVAEKVTGTSAQHIKRWMECNDTVDNWKSRLNGAECDARNAVTALVKFMLPDDAKSNEKFYIWHWDGLLACWRSEAGTPYAQWRKKPSKMV